MEKKKTSSVSNILIYATSTTNSTRLSDLLTKEKVAKLDEKINSLSDQITKKTSEHSNFTNTQEYDRLMAKLYTKKHKLDSHQKAVLLHQQNALTQENEELKQKIAKLEEKKKEQTVQTTQTTTKSNEISKQNHTEEKTEGKKKTANNKRTDNKFSTTE